MDPRFSYVDIDADYASININADFSTGCGKTPQENVPFIRKTNVAKIVTFLH